MDGIGLKQFSKKDSAVPASGWNSPWLIKAGGFYTPGYWVALAALAKKHKIAFEGLNIEGKQHQSYCNTIGLPKVLGGVDRGLVCLSDKPKTYSPLVLLEHSNAVELATQQITGCVRRWFLEDVYSKFIDELGIVIAEVHDNVWSHGQSTGFSMAQTWSSKGKLSTFEFALADCGLGFQRELARVGQNMTEQGAIKWCVQSGNSSKLINHKNDPWAQRLPPDIMGNPMPGAGKVVNSENHHQGLGLAKLVEVVRQYRGKLLIWSGQCIFEIDDSGDKRYLSTTLSWPGVALACQFNFQSVSASVQNQGVDDAITKQLIDLLGE